MSLWDRPAAQGALRARHEDRLALRDVERTPRGSWVRIQRDPFSAGETARRAGQVHPDEEVLASIPADVDYCPACNYLLRYHVGDRCPTESEARFLAGDR